MKVEIILYNGYDYPEQVSEIDGCGFDGPVLGPFDEVQITYGQHIKCYDLEAKGVICELFFVDDLVEYQGKYYGDFIVRSKEV